MFITEKIISADHFSNDSVDPGCGGSAFFIGRVRNQHEGRNVLRLYYECFKPMAEKQIQKLVLQVRAEFGVQDLRVIHRVGVLEIGEIAVFIAAHGAHRNECFLACRALIDRIKSEVPLWKKEFYEDGSSDWVMCSHLQEAKP